MKSNANNNKVAQAVNSTISLKQSIQCTLYDFSNSSADCT